MMMLASREMLMLQDVCAWDAHILAPLYRSSLLSIRSFPACLPLLIPSSVLSGSLTLEAGGRACDAVASRELTTEQRKRERAVV